MMPIVVTHQAGARFSAQVGAHEIILDQPSSGGGQDAGPSPLDLLGASLGGCIALYVQRSLASRGVALDAGFRVEVTQYTVRNPYRVGRFEVRVLLPDDIVNRYQSLLQGVARACPAYHTLARTADIVIEIETPAAIG
jgi:putative redox protein